MADKKEKIEELAKACQMALDSWTLNSDDYEKKYYPRAHPPALVEVLRSALALPDELANGNLLKTLNGLKRGSCWCEAGIDNPMMAGRHSADCLAAQVAIEDHQARRTVECPVEKLLAIRDALIKRDISEAYHQLYALADPEFKRLHPWKEWENLAERNK
jgi:hypothetical protein